MALTSHIYILQPAVLGQKALRGHFVSIHWTQGWLTLAITSPCLHETDLVSNTRQPCIEHTQPAVSIIKVLLILLDIMAQHQWQSVDHAVWLPGKYAELSTVQLNSHDLCAHACCKYTGNFNIDTEQCSGCFQARSSDRRFCLHDKPKSRKQVAA